MNIEHMATLFASSFSSVCLIGLQSQFVRDKMVATSFCTSMGVGLCEMIKLKLGPAAETYEIASFIMGGSFGIISSIGIHSKILNFLHKRKTNDLG